MDWNNSHNNPPENGQKVYYFGPHIGIWVGTYQHKINGVNTNKGYVELCPHLFYCDDGFGVVDACDAPFWLPYDAERESKGWRPIVPPKYTKDLYDCTLKDGEVGIIENDCALKGKLE